MDAKFSNCLQKPAQILAREKVGVRKGTFGNIERYILWLALKKLGY